VILLFAACLGLTGCGTGNYGHEWQINPDAGVLNWRERDQNGTSPQIGLPSKAALEGKDKNLRWALSTPGRGTATIGEYSDGPRLFVLGYPGDGAALLETLYCVNPETGKVLWQRGYGDFISDIVYNRYTIGGPTVDPDTGNVYIQTSPGLLIALDRDGNELWQVSLMEDYGRLTFPNGRTGVVTIDGNLAIVNIISSNWGSDGPARNRFYAFDKNTGQLVWSSTPGVGPPFLSDSSFSTPYIENRRGYRVFYAGTGCGNLVCVNIRTGQPIWRYQMSKGGVNGSPVLYDNGTPDLQTDDLIIELHGVENIDDTGRGYMIAVRADQAFAAGIASAEKPLQVDKSMIAWRNDDVSSFTSSPTLVGNTVYQCTEDGYLVAIDARNGKTQWKVKIGADQLHASPVYAEGRLYLPFWNDGLFIITPGKDGPANIEHAKLEGQCIGTPTVWNGKIYIHTTEKLYCFGNKSGGVEQASDLATSYTGVTPPSSPPASLLVQPAEFLLKPGQSVSPSFKVINTAGEQLFAKLSELSLTKFIPPTAKVKVEMDATIDGTTITASQNNSPSAGAFKLSASDLSGTMRGRVLPEPPYSDDFEEFALNEKDELDNNIPYAYPPLPWIGARLKWQVRDDPTNPGNNKVLAKTLDKVLFQRSMIFLGHSTDTGYTIQADVMSDGNRRGGSVVGVICQRYIIALDANKNIIEVSSNPNRIAINQPFTFKTQSWYTIKAKVIENPDGSGVVMGKAWPRGEAEPEAWTIEAVVPNVHTQGSPGIYGFSPQSRHRVYVDNVDVSPSK